MKRKNGIKIRRNKEKRKEEGNLVGKGQKTQQKRRKSAVEKSI